MRAKPLPFTLKMLPSADWRSCGCKLDLGGAFGCVGFSTCTWAEKFYCKAAFSCRRMKLLAALCNFKIENLLLLPRLEELYVRPDESSDDGTQGGVWGLGLMWRKSQGWSKPPFCTLRSLCIRLARITFFREQRDFWMFFYRLVKGDISKPEFLPTVFFRFPYQIMGRATT